jgi:hypothetical protein
VPGVIPVPGWKRYYSQNCRYREITLSDILYIQDFRYSRNHIDRELFDLLSTPEAWVLFVSRLPSYRITENLPPDSHTAATQHRGSKIHTRALQNPPCMVSIPCTTYGMELYQHEVPSCTV